MARPNKEQIEQIIEHRQRGVSVRKTAELLGTSAQTVQAHYKKWLQAEGAKRLEDLGAEREALVTRYTWMAEYALRKAAECGANEDDANCVRYLAEARQQYKEIGRILGLEVIKVEHSGTVTLDVNNLSDEELLKIIEVE